jgi:hypothetical protein
MEKLEKFIQVKRHRKILRQHAILTVKKIAKLSGVKFPVHQNGVLSD